MYKSYLRGPRYFLAGELTKVGSLHVESRLHQYLIAYILVQHNTNYAQPTMNDLKFMFAIKEGILVMAGIAKSSSRLHAFGIIISRVIDHLGIDTSDMEKIVVNSRKHLVGDNLIHKMCIYKYGDEWMYEDDHNTTVDLDLFDEDENTNQDKQNPEHHDEASHISEGPSFELAHLEAME
ncbi:hypothetical protein Lal_00033568 [Lupinus albus]|nr:hypothetical protein Lal_00033568 [Lupinus albus]